MLLENLEQPFIGDFLSDAILEDFQPVHNFTASFVTQHDGNSRLIVTAEETSTAQNDDNISTIITNTPSNREIPSEPNDDIAQGGICDDTVQYDENNTVNIKNTHSDRERLGEQSSGVANDILCDSAISFKDCRRVKRNRKNRARRKIRQQLRKKRLAGLISGEKDHIVQHN